MSDDPSQTPVRLTVVTIRELCNACSIVEEAVRQIVGRLTANLEGLEVKWAVYQDQGEASAYPGLEMPNFPALFLGDEQVSAGTIPDRRELEKWIRERRNSA